MNNKFTLMFLVAVGALVAGLAGGYWYATSETDDAAFASLEQEPQPLFYRNPMNPEVTSPVPAKDQMGMDYIPVYADEEKPKEILFYRNPMNPEITSPVPAKDQMGMDYVPVYADADESGPAGTVSIDPVTVQNIGVRTAVAEVRTIAREINTLGRVDYDGDDDICFQRGGCHRTGNRAAGVSKRLASSVGDVVADDIKLGAQ